MNVGLAKGWKGDGITLDQFFSPIKESSCISAGRWQKRVTATGALHLHGLFPSCHTSWRPLPPAANSHQSSRVSLNAIAS